MSETGGRCRREITAAYESTRYKPSDSDMLVADAIDRLAADVAAIKAKVDALSPEDVAHLVESEKAFAELFAEQRDAAIRERDEARAEAERLKAARDRLIYLCGKQQDEVERLKAELAARSADGNSPGTLDSSPAAPQPAAPPAGWLTERERRAVAYFAEVCRDDLVPDEWTDNAGVLRSILSRAGSPPVVEVPAISERDVPKRNEALAYRAALDKAGVPWKEVGRE